MDSIRLGCVQKLTVAFVLIFVGSTVGRVARADSQEPAEQDNGIHVGAPKVYDSRELTLMLEGLSQSIQGKSFIDPKELAKALGNVQGYQSSDYSQAFFANGAVGPGAAAVFAGSAAAAPVTAASTTAPAATTSPSITINVSPTSTSGTGTATDPTAVAAAPTSSVGPQPPALPGLQTAPAYTPKLGSNSADLLSDEVNLTYQLSNIRLLLERSLTDRLFHDEARLQAVVGFDVDLEPDQRARDAAAVVQITAELSEPSAECDMSEPLSLVALMPEEGSHNAATLSQKANAFGGAIAASVFSVGFQGQSRHQTFYLYRDMDTLSFEEPANKGGKLLFGWQFRPVLGRSSVNPGMRHMIAVIGLPCTDTGRSTPKLRMDVRKFWKAYHGKTQTTSEKPGFFSHSLPDENRTRFPQVAVPTTEVSQGALAPRISDVRWIPSDATNGVAVVTGENFFPGTTVRVGNKTFGGASDGLVIKSDQEIEVAMPLGLIAVGGIVSGRYGKAVPLQPSNAPLGARFSLQKLHFDAEGSAMYQVTALLKFDDSSGSDEVLGKLNGPLVLLNGVPLAGQPYPSLSPLDANQNTRTLTAFVPAAAFANGATVFTVSFPFAGAGWTASASHYETTLKVSRLGGLKQARLLISATNPADLLCDERWDVQLDGGKSFAPLKAGAALPKGGGLRCADPHEQILALDMPAKDLKGYHHLLLVNRPAAKAGAVTPRAPLIGDIPAPDPPPPGPSLDKDQSVSVGQFDVHPVKFTGKHLDEITKVSFDNVSLPIVAQDDKSIVIGLSRQVTDKVRAEVGLLLISDGNDPLIAKVIVVAAKTAVPKTGGK